MFKKLVLKNYYGVEAILFCAIRFYQQFISPYLGNHCRFYPSCSEYSCLAIKKYGAVKGCWKALMRILRCHPFNGGGIDYP